MRALLTALLSVCLVASVVTEVRATGSVAPPDAYAYLDNPRMTGEGQQAPHAELRPYADVASAARREERTPYTASLDGQWKIAVKKIILQNDYVPTLLDIYCL